MDGLEEGRTMEEEESRKNLEEEEGETKASGSTTDEESDSEPESPTVIRRKVSFADAFGLNLVSVKEFDNVEVAEVRLPPENEASHPTEDFYMSCLFTVPSSQEDLDQRLSEQMVELESITLLPGTTTLRGFIRVVNLCYNKSVYARMSLDRWSSYFDLLAEYLPGSSDRKTDRFTFRYTLVPPFERGGTRVEVCLRYETAVGTFWANNKEMNYVLFCHQKGHGKEPGPPVQEENLSYKSKRSCLKANRRGSADEKTRDLSNPSAAAAEVEVALKAEEADRKDSTDIESSLYHEEHKPVVESIKSRHRAARMARVQDYLSRRRHQAPTAAYSHDSAEGQKVSPPVPAMWSDSAGVLHKRQKKQPNETPQVLTYHQIPLLTLDWNNDKAHQWGSADADDIWTENAKITLSKASEENTEASVGDILLNGTDDADTETSVCDVWQAFLNGPSCTNHSAVRESEWLQTAASVSPSNDKEPGAQYAASSHGFQVGTDTPATLQARTSALCQLLSGTCQITSANVALNSEDQPAEACVSSPTDDNTAQDASQRSQTNSVTDTRQEFCPEGATPVSEGYVDSSTECHEHTISRREREEIIGRGEPFTPHAADSVTSSGESETTDMTATPPSQNATAGDRIAQGAGLDEGLSSSREEEVTGIAHNVMDDMMAFRGTIEEGTKDGERFVFPRQGGIAENCVGNKAATDEEIFRPGKTDECEISQRYADETQHEEFRLNQNSENPLRENERNEKRLAQTNADESNLSPTSEENFKRNQIISSESEESEHVASNNSEVSEKTEVEDSYCTTSDETKGRIGAAVGITLTEEHGDKALPLKSSSITAEEEERVQRDSIPKENLLVSNQTEEGKSISWEINSAGVKSRQDVCDKFNEGNQNPVDASEDDTKGKEEAVECGITPGEVQVQTSIAEKDTSPELQRQHGTLERTREVMSQRDADERVRIGKLEIDVGESRGNAENPRGEKKYAELKEQELSADVNSSPRGECKSFSEGTKYPITAENTLDVMESGLEEMFIERFGEDLVRRIWEEVFGRASNRDIVDEMGGERAATPDITPDCRLFETDSDDAFDSGVFSLTDPNLATKSNDCSPEEAGQPEQTHSHSESQTDLNSSAQIPILAAQPPPSLTETTKRSPKEHDDQIKDGSVTRQETETQTEVVARREGFYRSLQNPTSSCDALAEPVGVAWWSLFYVLGQITRLLVCGLLVAGFFVCVFLYDFPAFFALYVFSCCWWFYKWKRHRAMTNKGMVGVAES